MMLSNQTAMKSLFANHISLTSEQLFALLGTCLLRFTLVFFLLWFGLLKFTAAEAAGIQPFISASPLMAWMYRVLSVQGASDVIGVIEITCALLIASRRFSPTLSAVGSLGGVITFLLTLSFVFTTSGIVEHAAGALLPVPSLVGSFLLKDLGLLAASFSTAGEALAARQRRHKVSSSSLLMRAGASS